MPQAQEGDKKELCGEDGQEGGLEEKMMGIG